MRPSHLFIAGAVLFLFPVQGFSQGASGLDTFQDIAATDPALGAFAKQPSFLMPIAENIFQQSLSQPITVFQVLTIPLMARGLIGVSVFDFDGDGLEDVYVTNGIAAANALLRNLGGDPPEFEDVAFAAGVAAADHDSSGTCYADADNDGDFDLLVLGYNFPHRLFVNNGNSTFSLGPALPPAQGPTAFGTSCTFADFNADGLHDVYIAYSGNHFVNFDCVISPQIVAAENQLLVNQGGNAFADESLPRGTALGQPRITWSVSSVDHDGDGDVDLFLAEDQCGLRASVARRGFNRLFENDGNGFFSDRSDKLGNFTAGWMGHAWADFDGNSKLDLFATNVGPFYQLIQATIQEYDLGDSLVFFQDEGGMFSPAPRGANGNVGGTPFGWGATAVDLANTGRTDVVYHGGLDASNLIIEDNPGAALVNDGKGGFVRDETIFSAVSHQARNVRAVAQGDFNDDGFPDIVSASSFNFRAGTAPRIPFSGQPGFGAITSQFSHDPEPRFDTTLRVVDEADPNDPFDNLLQWNGLDFDPGDLALEMNPGNDNRWIKIRVRGTVDVLPKARTPRDGIGAVIVTVPCDDGDDDDGDNDDGDDDDGEDDDGEDDDGEEGTERMAQTIPVIGGASHASQDSLIKTFGLGSRAKANVTVHWPGGTRNTLRGVRSGERILFPEIPCDLDGSWTDDDDFEECVEEALEDLVAAGVLDEQTAERFQESMEEAF